MSQVKKCKAITQTGKKCSRNALDGEIYCKQHLKIYQPEEEEKILEEKEFKTNERLIISTKLNKYKDIINQNIGSFKITSEAEELTIKIIESLYATFFKEKEEIADVYVKRIMADIFSDVSTYIDHPTRTITYLTLNQTIAHELFTTLDYIIVPSKYTLLRSYYTKKIPVHIVEREFKIHHNFQINKDAIHFVQQYIYWNFENLSDEVKLAIFPTSNPKSIDDFFVHWFQKMLSLFKTISGKIEYKTITDLILQNDIFSEYQKQKIKMSEEFLEPIISKDVTKNIFSGYL